MCFGRVDLVCDFLGCGHCKAMKLAYGDATKQMHDSGVGDLACSLGWIEMEVQRDRQTDS